MMGCGPQISCVEPEGFSAAGCADPSAVLICARRGCERGPFDDNCESLADFTEFVACRDGVVEDCPFDDWHHYCARER